MSTILTIPGSSSPCAFCEDLPWPSVPLQNGDGGSGTRPGIDVTVQGLQDSADRGCLLCQFFWTMLINDAEKRDAELNELSTCWLEIRMSVVYGVISVILKLDNKGFSCKTTLDCDFRPVPLDVADRQISHEVRHVRCKCAITAEEGLDYFIETKSAFEGTTIAQDLKDIVDHEINPWMNDCCNQKVDHKNCGAASGTRQMFQLSDKKKILPRRYLDLGSLEEHSIKLVDDHTLAPADRTQYLILSYCWGADNDTARTTVENLQARYIGIADVAFPKTIQDAIRLTRLMGFRYLWIDAICIVQSIRHNDQGEFKEEAKRMGHYYANALCCISASRASDSREGFLSHRPLAKHPLRPITIQLSTYSGSQTHTMTLIGDVDRDDFISTQLSTSPLRQRGWYLQELLLSQRILHWTEFGLYRECRTSWFVEGQRTRWTGARQGWLRNPRDCLNLSKDGTLTSTGWYTLVHHFSFLSLTFAEDRDHAIQGIASLFAQDLGDGHVYGLFPSSLSEGLAWYSCEDPQDRKPRQNSFPGWSWASNGRVWFEKLNQSRLYAEIRPSHLVQGPVTSAPASGDHLKLFIKAPLLTLTFTGEGWIKIKRTNHPDWIQGSSYVQLDNPLGLATSLIEASELVKKPGTTVHWLLLGNRYSRYCGLLVQRVADAEEDTFVRYGLLRLKLFGRAEIEECYDELTEMVLV